MARIVRLRVVASGNILEVSEYSKGVWIEHGSNGGRKQGEEEGQDVEGNRRKASQRARRNVIRQANANFSDVVNAKFLSFTFRDGAVNDVTNVRECNYEFMKFVQRLRRRYPDLAYLAVIEFQDKNGRGAVHYHMICNLPYIKAQELEKLWGCGTLRIKRIDEVDDIGAYLVKYMVKDIADVRLQGEKGYLGSRNLIKSTQMYGEEAKAVREAYKLGDKVKPTYSATFESEHVGTVEYNAYNLSRPSGGGYTTKGNVTD